MLVRPVALTGFLSLLRKNVRPRPTQTLHPCHPSWSWDNSYLYGAQVSIENTTTSPDQWTQCDPNDPLEYDCSEAGLKNAGGRTTTIRRNYRCVNEGYYWEQPGTPMGNFGWILERECDVS